MPASHTGHCKSCGQLYVDPLGFNGPGCPRCSKPSRLSRRITDSTRKHKRRGWRNAIAAAALACLAYAFNNRGPVSDWLFVFFMLLMLVHSVLREQF